MSFIARVLSVPVSRADYLIAYDFSNADAVSRKYIDTRLAAHVPPSRRHASERERKKTLSVMLSRVWHRLSSCNREKGLCFHTRKIYPSLLWNDFPITYRNTYCISFDSHFLEINFYHHVVPFSYLTRGAKKNIFVLSQKKKILFRIYQHNLTQSRFSNSFGSHLVLFRVDGSGDKLNRTHTQASIGRNLYQRFRAATCTMFVSLRGYVTDENGRNFKQSIDIHSGHSNGHSVSLLFSV